MPDTAYPAERDAAPVRLERATYDLEGNGQGAPRGTATGGAEAWSNPLHVTFSYAVPEELDQHIAPGQLVEVPFRSGSLQGVVVGLSDAPPPDVDARPLISILDPRPVLTPLQIELASWLSARYLAHLSSCTWLFLPPGARRPPQTVVEAVTDKQPPPDMDARAAAMLLYLRGQGRPLPADELEAEPLKLLSDIQLGHTWQRLAPPRIGPQIDRTVELIAPPEEVATVLPTLGHPSKQADLLLHLTSLDDPLPSVDEVLGTTGASEAPLRALAERGWVRITPKRTWVAAALAGEAVETALSSLARSPAQQAALAFLRDHPGPLEPFQIGASSGALAALEAKGYLRRWTEPASVSLSLDADQVLGAVLELRGAARHAAVLDLLAEEEGRVWVGWVYAQTEANLDILNDLAEAGLVVIEDARRWRDPLAEQSFVLEEPPRLTPDQEAVWEVIRNRGIRNEESGNQELGIQEARNRA
jgi:primosomal protein N'